MQILWTIQHMFPNATDDNLEVSVFVDGTWKITKWNLPDPQPAQADVEAYWTANQQAIETAHQKPPSDLDTLKANQALMQKAIDDLILGGVS